MDMAIKNCKVVSPEGVYSAAIGIKGEKIVAIAGDDELPQANKVIDAKGNYVLPGLVDAHCHLEYPYDVDIRTNIKTETQSYAFGGVTTISHMMTVPPFDLVEKFKKFVPIYEENAYIDLSISPEITMKEHIMQIRQLMELGMPTFKMQPPYKGAQARPNIPGIDDGHIYLVFESIGKLVREGYNTFCRIHCENIELFFPLMERAIAQGEEIRSWHQIRPSFIEIEAMHRYIYLASITGCPLYIVHMSIKEGVDIVAKAKAEGINVIAETCPHYLVLNVDNSDPVLSKLNPPIREKEDNKALWKGIRDGVITVVGTDHAPTRRKDKPDLLKAWMGFTGGETWLPIMLDGVNKGNISMEKLVEVCCYNPARLYGLYPRKGAIAVGSDADLVIVDLNKEATVPEVPLYSGTDLTPFAGSKFKGWPVLTILRGKVIMEDGKVVGTSGYGRFIPGKVK